LAADLFTTRVKVITKILLTFVVVVPCLYVILSGHYSADVSCWAGGVVGVAIGYWLR